MLILRSLLLAFVSSFIAPLSLLAQFPMPTTRQLEDTQPAHIHELVSKYCRFDYEGARLNPQGWTKIEPLVSWKSAPDFTKINVVARYKVDMPEASSSHGKSTVSVHYRLLGTFDLATGYIIEPPGTDQDVAFIITTDNDDNRIADAENTLPHPSRATMLKWLNEKLSAAQDDATKNRYQDAIRQLSAQSASPFAK